MTHIAPAFLAGILLVQHLATLPNLPWLMLCAITAGFMAYKRYRFGTFFCLGILWAALIAGDKLADRLPEPLAGVDIPITGVIADLPHLAENQVRFDFTVTDAPPQTPKKLKLSWYYPKQTVKAGQHWRFNVKLKPPHGSLNAGGMDYEQRLLIEGVGATGTVRPYPKPELIGVDSPWTHISVWRQWLSDRLADAPVAADNLGLLKALTIGDGSGISPAQWEVFRKTGTTHLVVISGSHIGLIAGLVYVLALKLWAYTGYLRWSPQKVAAAVAVLGGVFYAGLAGFGVPAQRAVVMLAVMMWAIIRQRPARAFNTLAFALFAVLVYDPLAVLAAGFWLSFVAVAVIFYAVAGRLGKPKVWAEALSINWISSLGLSPLLLWFFQQVSVCAPLANLLAVPVISLLVVPLALVATALLLLWPPLATPLFYGLDMVLHYFRVVLEWFAALPLATINHPQPSVWALLLALSGLLLIFAPPATPARYLGLVMLLPLVFPTTQKLQAGEINMTMLDVGQGLAVVVQTANHWLVYDTGAKFSPQSDSGQQVLLPFLRMQAVGHLDKLIISHGDNDHIGGAASLLQALPVDNVLSSVPEQFPHHAAVLCAAGQTWQWDAVTFTVLSPPTTLFPRDNNNSCVIKIDSPHGSALLTGDIEAEAENGLLQTYHGALHAEVLIAAHHGSKTSSTASFLQAVQPSTVLIPAGYRNPFGHPHPKIMQRYQALGAQTFSSADSGAVTVSFKNHAVAVQPLRQIEARYWHYRR
jgi:competence protein ComEC